MPSFSSSRRIVVDAPPSAIRPLINDFKAWIQWSPWEGLDPDLERTYTGPERGVGAAYAWTGNRKAGSGSMEITGSSPEAVDITVHFLKPFKATNQTTLSFEPVADGTQVRWVMTGEQKGAMAVFGKFMNMDKLIGPDFEKGLARLKAVAEETPAD